MGTVYVYRIIKKQISIIMFKFNLVEQGLPEKCPVTTKTTTIIQKCIHYKVTYSPNNVQFLLGVVF